MKNKYLGRNVVVSHGVGMWGQTLDLPGDGLMDFTLMLQLLLAK